MPTLINDISATDWSLKLGEIGGVVEELDDINQCIRIILETPKGSRPHEPEFGSDLWRYIDYPTNESIPHIVRETVDALNIWEPRIKVVKVAPVVGVGQVTVQIEWTLNEDDSIQLTEVIYGAA